ncbi:MAG TPA: hypothetical protein PK854_11250 [Oscillospiraceae bacterium]|nr:hypothetical protein [Oscillospiraceae bacterium]HPS35827.1 hypothetical protein [Oscillospiraceae bacterium]
MKQRKYWLLIGFAVLFAFSACMQTPQSSEASSIPAASNPESSETNSVPDIYSQPSVPSGSPYTLDEYKAFLQPHLEDDAFINFVEAYNVHTSPDGKNQYIEIVAEIGYWDTDWTYYISYLFLNDFEHFVKDYGYKFRRTVKWIDNEQALIDRETIIDIETGQEKNIMDNSYRDHFESSFIIASDVNAAGTKIVTFNILYPEEYWIKPAMQYLYLYDIAEDKWELLFEISFFYEDPVVSGTFIKWKTDDCIEFYLHNGAKFSYTLSSLEVTEVPNFVVKDGDVYDAARLKRDKGFAGEETIYIYDIYTDKVPNICTYMEENNLKIAPGEYSIYYKDTREDMIKKLHFVPNN